MPADIFDTAGGLPQTRRHLARVRLVGRLMAIGLVLTAAVLLNLHRDYGARLDHIARTFSALGIVTYTADGLLSGDPDMMVRGRHELVALDLTGFATSAGIVTNGPACAERAMILARRGEIWACLPEAEASEVWAIPELQNS